MRGSINKRTLTLQIGNKFVSLQCRELEDTLFTFEGGSVYLGEEGIVGGILIDQRKFYFSGDSLENFKITPKVYPPANIPPYRGYATEDVVKVRLYEPTIFEIPLSDLYREVTFLQGVWYHLVNEGGWIKIIPISESQRKLRSR